MLQRLAPVRLVEVDAVDTETLERDVASLPDVIRASSARTGRNPNLPQVVLQQSPPCARRQWRVLGIRGDDVDLEVVKKAVLFSASELLARDMRNGVIDLRYRLDAGEL